MQKAKFIYNEPKLVVYLTAANNDIAEYLTLGLRFDKINNKKFIKQYDNADHLAEELNQINSEIKDFGFRLEFDPFLSSLIKKEEFEQQELDTSLAIGRKIKKDKNIKIELPANFYREPKKFQIQSISHIINIPYVANFSVPGSGKTTISLAAYSVLKERKIVDHLIVVCPRSAFLPWEEEFEACFGRFPKSIRISGDSKSRIRLYLGSENVDLFLITYQMLKFEEKNIENLLKTHTFFMILDESHHIKNFEGGIHANIVRRLGIYAKRRLILSGTPVPNNLEDLWNQFTFLWPKENLLGTKYSYKEKIQSSPSEIKRKIDPLFIRINKDELKIPKPIIIRTKIKLDEEHYEFYQELAKTVLYKANNIGNEDSRVAFYRICMAWLLEAIDDPSRLMLSRNVQLKLGKNLKLLKAFSNYKKNAEPQKINYCNNLIKYLIKKKQKTILWTYFVSNIEGLTTNELKKFNPLPLYGGIPRDDTEDQYVNRERYIRIFKNDPKRRLLIANPAACAESISLHDVCKNAVYLDRTFNCAQYLQSIDRIHRIGIKVSPQIRICIASKTLDEVVDRRLEEKKDLMLKLLEDPFKPIDLETSGDDYFGKINKKMEDEAKIDLELFEDELRKA